MQAVIDSIVSGFPVLIIHFLVTVTMLAIGVSIYTLLTPYKEIELIREGNLAAAISKSGAVVGLGIPLAVCLATSVSTIDIVFWGVISLLIQIVCYRVADLVLKDLPQRIVAGEVGPALWLVSVKLSVAIINAAAIAG